MKIYPFFLRTIIFPFLDRVSGTKFSFYTRMFSKMEKMSADEIRAWQTHRLNDLIHHVYEKVPFYRDFMKKNGILPEHICTAADLMRFPELKKQLMRENIEQFVPDNLADIKHIKTGTGGSTGTPLRYNLSLEAHSAVWAKKIVMLRRFGFELGEKYLALGSSQIVPNSKNARSDLFHKLIRVVPLNATNMNPGKCAAAIQLIRQHKIRMIYGYASAIYLLAKYVQQNNIDLHVDLCVSTSEKLTDQYEELIAGTFKCRVLDEYGARDAGLYTMRCEKGRFHMIESCLFNLSGGATEGRGSIVATNLLNFAMPFINYNLEDIVTIHHKECECGFRSSTLSEIVGRQSEVMLLKNGGAMTGPAFCTLFQKLPVKCYQFAQKSEALIEVRISRDQGYSEATETLIREAIRNHVGEEYSIVFNYDYEFAPLINGKRNYFISA